ncbi:MAG: hypothetical protein OJF49_000870 [Ktedonobacterales bacterium]|jgi:hypothetical protein|nr:MAG: hypothetical protein OJF49_000870 [Ktedonobacterales bacterium]
MPLSPAPLLPGTNPIPIPGRKPPSAKALRLSVLIALPVLVVSLVVGQALLPWLLFLAPGLQAQANTNTPGAAGASSEFQGFDYPWTRQEGYKNAGYTSPASLANMKDQAKTYHMNSVIIPIVADMPYRSDSYIAWHNTDKNDRDTLPQSDYEQAIKDARTAGLVPILELQIQQQDPYNDTNPSGDQVGSAWTDLPSTASYQSPVTNTQVNVGKAEKAWFDNYVAFAATYAQLSAKYHLPYFIVGDSLTSVSYDTDATSAKNDPKGIDRSVPGDSCPQNATGRRECEWRHVINAIEQPNYNLLSNHTKSLPGGDYKGKLIYAASWSGSSSNTGTATSSEFDHIAWWDAVDIIGINAYFPLTNGALHPPINVLMDAWHGKQDSGAGSGGQGDIYGKIEKLSAKFDRPVLFTEAGYPSYTGASAGPNSSASSTDEDDVEQLNDMQALVQTFSGASWWEGVFWYYDLPVPRDKLANWNVDYFWAGPTLDTSKAAAKWLASYYKDNPIQCSC